MRGLWTQINWFASRVRTHEPVTELEPVVDQVENTRTMEEDHHELADYDISQAMLRVLQGIGFGDG